MICQVLDSLRDIRKRVRSCTWCGVPSGTWRFLVDAHDVGPSFCVSDGDHKHTRQASKAQAWLCPLDLKWIG